MKKSETVGEIGEEIFKDIIIKNSIPYIDLREHIIHKSIKGNSKYQDPEYTYISNTFSHPFDFIVNGLNIEIKTSTIHNYTERINFGWKQNDYKHIDYIVGLVLNKDKTLKDLLIFDNEYINSHIAFGATYKSKYLPIITKDKLVELLKNK